MAEGDEHGKGRDGLVLLRGEIEDGVEAGRIAALAEITLPRLQLHPALAAAGGVGRVGGDDHVHVFPQKSHGLVGHGVALALGLCLVDLGELGGGALDHELVFGCAGAGLFGGCA